MIHLYHKGKKDQTFLLLHGTGGNEEDLIPLAKYLDKEANILSVRGNVLENGMPRFFKRLSAGIFDLDSLAEETKNLYDFMLDSAAKYHFKKENITVLGYSNGANIALNMLFSFHKPFQRAILFHPMIPRKKGDIENMSDVHIFIGAGSNDPLVSKSETKDLLEILEKAHAKVDLYWTNQGHQLNKDEMLAAKYWYDKKNR